MRVVIAGGGNVGTFIARELRKAGHDVLLIEQDPSVVSRSAPTLTGPRETAEHQVARRPTPARSRRCGGRLGTVDVVVAATGDDEDNLVVSLLAKQEFAVPRVVARVNHPKNEWLFNETWGVDVAVSTPHLLTALVEEAVVVGTPGPPAAAREGPGPPGRGHAGRRLAGHGQDDPGARRAPRRHRRGRHARGPRGRAPGRHRVPGGDEVLALVTPESEDEVRQILTGK